MKTHIGTAFNFQRSLAPDANAEKPISLPILLWNISWWVLVFLKIWKRNTVFAPCPSEKTTKFLSWKDNTRETKEKSLKFTDLDGASMLKNSPKPKLMVFYIWSIMIYRTTRNDSHQTQSMCFDQIEIGQRQNQSFS